MIGNLFYIMLIAPVVVFCGAMVLRHWIRMRLSGSLRRRLIALRESGRLFAVMAIVVPSLYLLANALMLHSFGGSLFIRELRALPMAMMFAAMQLTAFAHRSVGTHWKCSKCHYDLRGLPEYQASEHAMRHDAQCPECGEQWGWPGGSIKVEKKWSRGWIAICVILVAPLIAQFASIPLFGIGSWERATLKLAPTSSLVEEVLTARGFTIDAWAELQSRTLSDRNVSRIGTALLSRPVGAYFSQDETAWLTRTIVSHALDPHTIEPLLDRLFTVSAKRADPSNGITLTFTPQPTSFAAFSGVDVGVWVTSSHIGRDQFSAFAVAGSGYTLYTTHSLGPYVSASSRESNRFRGIATVALIPREPGRGPGKPPDTLMTSPTGLYKLDIPLDLTLESAK